MKVENSNDAGEKRTLKQLVNTPFKRSMLIIQFISYILIPGSPLIGGAIARIMELNAKQTGLVILIVFILGEILFYGSLFFLGKEVGLLLRDKLKARFKRRKKPTNPS